MVEIGMLSVLKARELLRDRRYTTHSYRLVQETPMFALIF